MPVLLIFSIMDSNKFIFKINIYLTLKLMVLVAMEKGQFALNNEKLAIGDTTTLNP